MRTVFADTFYFIALVNPSDATHDRAVELTAGNAVRMLTTEWVLTELADGLAKSPRGRMEFLATLADLQTDDDATIIPCGQALMAEGAFVRTASRQGLVADRLQLIRGNDEGRHHRRPYWRPSLRAGRLHRPFEVGS